MIQKKAEFPVVVTETPWAESRITERVALLVVLKINDGVETSARELLGHCPKPPQPPVLIFEITNDELIDVIAHYDNICNFVHLPFQAGDNDVLKRMNRNYTREWYMNRIEALRAKVPDVALSTDILTGFCGETDEQHEQTLDLMRQVKFDSAFMFKYSNRPGTMADKRFPDDVPEIVKSKRLTEIINLQTEHSVASNQKDIGKIFDVLVESKSKRSEDEYQGRNSQNKVLIFPKGNVKPGDIVKVKVNEVTQASLRGELVK